MSLCNLHEIDFEWTKQLIIEHIKAQHVVWDGTPVPASVILDMLVKNIEHLTIEIMHELMKEKFR